MGILLLPIAILAAWLLAAFDVAAPGVHDAGTFSEAGIQWMLFIPGGVTFLVSGVMHTAFARATAKNIGWKTNGFQYEIGFVSFGLGAAGIIACLSAPPAWLPVAVAQSVFLVLAGLNHVRGMVKDQNFAPGNSTILLYDFGLPISYIILFMLNLS